MNMNRCTVSFNGLTVVLCSALVFICTSAQAHLMEAQNGTFNLQDGYGYLAVAIPASSLEFIDQEGDGLMSEQELAAQSSTINEQINKHIKLTSRGSEIAKVVAMISINGGDEGHEQPSRHLLVMLKFTLDKPAVCGAPDSVADLLLELSLFGNVESEKVVRVTSMLCDVKHEIVFDQNHPVASLF